MSLGQIYSLLQSFCVVYSCDMNKVVEELDQQLKQLDRVTAERVEQLVRDALALAGKPTDGTASSRWPDGYFERTAGALAGQVFDRPQQGSSPTREAW